MFNTLPSSWGLQLEHLEVLLQTRAITVNALALPDRRKENIDTYRRVQGKIAQILVA